MSVNTIYEVTVIECLKGMPSGTTVIICSRSDDGTEYMYGSVQVLDGVYCCTNVVYPLLKRRVIEQFIPARQSNKRYVYIDHVSGSIYKLKDPN